MPSAYALCVQSIGHSWVYAGITSIITTKSYHLGFDLPPYIFDKFATALNWILKDTCHLTDVIHYLDDFLNVSPPCPSIAHHHRALILDTFSYLNVPVAPEKFEGPAISLTFLGLGLDTERLEIRPPDNKRTAYLHRVSSILTSGKVSKRELASVLGNLSFATQPIPAGRTFFRRLYDLDRATHALPPFKVLCIPQTASDDLKWWQSTLETWDGKSFFLLDKWTPTADLQLQTDASGTLGYGAFYAGRWLHGSWRPSQESQSIQFKELYAIVVACSTWASAWQRLRIQFQCDNSAVVDCIRFWACRSADVFRRLAPKANPQPDNPVLPRLNWPMKSPASLLQQSRLPQGGPVQPQGQST